MNDERKKGKAKAKAKVEKKKKNNIHRKPHANVILNKWKKKNKTKLSAQEQSLSVKCEQMVANAMKIELQTKIIKDRSVIPIIVMCAQTGGLVWHYGIALVLASVKFIVYAMLMRVLHIRYWALQKTSCKNESWNWKSVERWVLSVHVAKNWMVWMACAREIKKKKKTVASIHIHFVVDGFNWFSVCVCLRAIRP